jgi:hypothetical protein
MNGLRGRLTIDKTDHRHRRLLRLRRERRRGCATERWKMRCCSGFRGVASQDWRLALLGSLLRYGARRAGVEDLARQRLSLPQGDAAEHDRRSPWSGR